MYFGKDAEPTSRRLTEAEDLEMLFALMRSTDEDPRELDRAHKKLRANKKLLEKVDKSSGMTLLHVGLLSECSFDKINMLLTFSPVIAKVRYRDQVPLHMALESNPKAEIIDKLIDAWEGGVREVDEDGVLPLHKLLDDTKNSSTVQALTKRVITLYQGAARVKSHDKLPLHICLEQAHPFRIIEAVLGAYRCGAAVPRKDGKLPLHIAVEGNLETRVVDIVLGAHPAALITKMGATDMLVLDYAIRNSRSQEMVVCLLTGGAFVAQNNPKSIAYARAAAIGRATKEIKQETITTHRSEELSNYRGEAQKKQRGRLKFNVKPHNMDPISIEMEPDAKVSMLKQKIQEKEGTPAYLQRLTLDGKQLMNDCDLSQFDIQRDCQINMVQRFEILQQAIQHEAGKDIILRLLKLRPESAAEDDQNGVLPLHLALKHHAEDEVIKHLLSHNPKAVKIEVNTSKYPLHLALELNYSHTVIKELLGNTNESEWDKSTGAYCPNGKVADEGRVTLPLHTAIKHGNSQETITLLLRSKCPIGARDKNTGNSALECMLASGRGETFFDMILRATLDANPKAISEAGPNGQRPLHVAVINNASVRIVDKLCELGRRVLEAKDLDGRMPIHLAVSRGAQFTVVRTLLHYNPESVNKTDGLGRTPLQLAVTHGASPGVVFEITRCNRKTLCVKDTRGRPLIELATEADAPTWVIRELLEAAPQDVASINLLNGRLQKTKAASEAMRLATKRQAHPGHHRIEAPANESTSQGQRPPRDGAVRGNTHPPPSPEQDEEESILNTVYKWFTG